MFLILQEIWMTSATYLPERKIGHLVDPFRPNDDAAIKETKDEITAHSHHQ